MRLNDGLADAKSHAGAVRLGSKKRVEDLVRMLWGKSYAGVADGDMKLLIPPLLRLDDHLTRSVYFLHRVDAVHDQIHHHLLQLHAISHDPGKIRGQFHLD